MTATTTIRRSHGLRALLLPGGVVVTAAMGAAYLHLVDPNLSGGYPPCLFYAVTGLWCPGCGSARALHALTHVDLGTALARNPFAVVAVVYAAWSFLAWSWRRYTGAPRRWLAPPWVLRGVLAAILGFWVLRNVPGLTWLSPL